MATTVSKKADKDLDSGANNSTEYFANTNVLTVRIKWTDASTFITDPRKSQLLASLNQGIHYNKGLLVNPKEMENYQYFSDGKRVSLLEEQNETYMFERGSVEVESWYSDEDLRDKKVNWFYDIVIQAQFKSFKDLEVSRKQLLADLRSVSDRDVGTIMQCWSVSENPHALNHPGNLYVRGIPKDLTKDDLVPIFAKFGPILVLKIIMDPNTNESMGFGFVSYPLGSQASTCIKELNGNLMNGSPLFVNYHVERKERERIHFDQRKHNEQEEIMRFKGVFVGNLPIFDADNKLITPETVLSEFKGLLPDCEVVSYYFPKTNSESNVEYSEESPNSTSSVSTASLPISEPEKASIGNLIDGNSTSNDNDNHNNNNSKNSNENSNDNQENDKEKKIDSIDIEATNEETCSSQDEESPLKGYGFIRFATHDMAVKCIQTFNEYEWYDHKLLVNKAVQKYHQHQHSNQHSNQHSSYSPYGNISYSHINSNANSNSNISSLNGNSNGSSNNFSGNGSNESYYQNYQQQQQHYHHQTHFPPMYPFRISRRHSERSISSRHSSMMSASPSSLTPVPLSQSQHQFSNILPVTQSLSRQNSYNKDQADDSHSPSSQPVFPISMHPAAGTLTPLVTQAIPLLTSSPTASTGSPRNNSIYGPLNMPVPFSNSNAMFNTPLPIPRSDEQESNLYVKHLPLNWRDDDLFQYFEKFGEIISAKIITVGGSIKEQDNAELKKDELFGKSKGYGFVCFQNPLDASRAMYHTDGLKLDNDHVLFVSFAQRRSKSIDSIKAPTQNFNYNKKFLNAIYQQQQQQYHPWMVSVPMHYQPQSN